MDDRDAISLLGQDLLKARATIERLTRERDEAVKATDRWRSGSSHLAGCPCTAEVARLTRERDELSEVSIGLRINLGDARLLAARLESERDEARAVLRECLPCLGAAVPLDLDGLRARIARALGGEK